MYLCCCACGLRWRLFVFNHTRYGLQRLFGNRVAACSERPAHERRVHKRERIANERERPAIDPSASERQQHRRRLQVGCAHARAGKLLLIGIAITIISKLILVPMIIFFAVDLHIYCARLLLRPTSSL